MRKTSFLAQGLSTYVLPLVLAVFTFTAFVSLSFIGLLDATTPEYLSNDETAMLLGSAIMLLSTGLLNGLAVGKLHDSKFGAFLNYLSWQSKSGVAILYLCAAFVGLGVASYHTNGMNESTEIVFASSLSFLTVAALMTCLSLFNDFALFKRRNYALFVRIDYATGATSVIDQNTHDYKDYVDASTKKVREIAEPVRVPSKISQWLSMFFSNFAVALFLSMFSVAFAILSLALLTQVDTISIHDLMLLFVSLLVSGATIAASFIGWADFKRNYELHHTFLRTNLNGNKSSYHVVTNWEGNVTKYRLDNVKAGFVYLESSDPHKCVSFPIQFDDMLEEQEVMELF